jgi:transcriptional regulator with XRE-family HTH domain
MNDTTTAKRALGALLRQLRTNNHLSLRELGDKSNLPHSLIAGIESGDRPAGPSVAVKLANALELLGDARDLFLLQAAQTTRRDHLLQEAQGLDAIVINFLPRKLIANGVVPAQIKSSKLVEISENGAHAPREQLNIELIDGRKVSCQITVSNN